MKAVELKEFGQFKVKDVITTMVGAPAAGNKAAEMRQRVRILDAVEGAKDLLVLEDADYSLLKDITENFPFAIANKDLLAVLDTIINFKSVPKKDKNG